MPGSSAFVPKIAKKTSSGQYTPKSMKAMDQDLISSSVKTPRVAQPGPRPNVNPELDSFEAVMNAMDVELSRLRGSTGQSKPPQIKLSSASSSASPRVSKGKGKEEDVTVSEDEDIETVMETELRAVLERGEDDDEFGEGEGTDYNLIKNFLESFKSQGGFSGPVSNLAGRLQRGYSFPRDEL